MNKLKSKNKKLIGIISSLLEGRDPKTGVFFESESIFNDEDMKEILLLSKSKLGEIVLEVKKDKIKNQKKLAGSRWTKEEDDKLILEYTKGVAPIDIAKKHKRSVRAVNLRVIKLLPEIIKYK